jgi:hypothetical protein
MLYSMPADLTQLLYGPYRTPRFRLGSVRFCEVRGEVTIVGITDARIQWPVGKRNRAKSLVIFGALARAVRRESATAVCYWWGVTPQTVTKWRKALGVGPVTDGTRRLKQDNGRSFTPEHIARLVAAANTPEANAKKGQAWLGKPRPPHVRALLRQLATGRTPSAEARARMSAAHRARRGHR